MRLSSILIIGVALLVSSSPLLVSAHASDKPEVSEEVAKERYKQAEEKLQEAHAAVKKAEAQVKSQAIPRQEEPKGNLRGSSALGRSSSPTEETNPVVVDEAEAELAEEQAKEALAKNDFEEAVTEMAKFFEFKEMRAAGMRARSAELDKARKEAEEKKEATP